ncbi:hypothetical protein OOZ19_27350 [Saccharopolyspora sp. NFXS83]|uniref:hypothetical protein n=1 Tax=Saccharopolyspora sp. NFXS83 TaxID=2993560 RepID=UPI00224B2409|nr:hypothetical protein [Saccharopolyspora sp. NFXS83]MCX2733976.1 hypothetical protein [Saccharopolyspora sp. NFXS83]
MPPLNEANSGLAANTSAIRLHLHSMDAIAKYEHSLYDIHLDLDFPAKDENHPARQRNQG